ncbi:uncharacterized protein UBRO_05674 [Ustilago bromivora]|uniref:Uncharacterized protein n=1 Tax=Ustilago bromivora TaxID=307758 RepID=A0A1K0G9E6_9BASI|nr:uncharacterized protein UBRO_05674 [Ustilago bromivora]SYW75976.1 uncharacterized protein UBRO2_01131 [Ustilago bromivora]
MVAALKGHKYSQRAAAVVSQHEDVLVQLCLLVDAIGLDRKSASKFVRLFKLVHSMDEFKNRVVEGDREVATSIVNILDVYEDSARIVKIRRSLIPVRKRTLTEAQRAGYQLLQTFERARSSQLESYAAEEKLLIEQLKALRSERDEFSRQ